jgi:hypothetical protein
MRQHTSGSKPKLLDQVRAVIRRKHYSLRTEEAYVTWIKRYILFHKKRHPSDMQNRRWNTFSISWRSRKECQPQLKTRHYAALVFLYREVLGKEMG